LESQDHEAGGWKDLVLVEPDQGRGR
jgi:hypothetical protein